MGARSKARKRALDVLYESDLRGVDPRATLQERLAQSDPPIAAYAVELVEGVLAHRDRIDALIARYSVDWTLDRMPPVDRNLLRLGAYEVLWNDAVPDAVAVSEAVDLARSLSTEQSPAFVNGVLGRLLELKSELLEQEQAELVSDAVDGPTGVDGQDAPADELLGEGARSGVVDHRE